MRGAVDTLRGLKENVLIGRIIPAGSGFVGSEKERIVREAAAAEERDERRASHVSPVAVEKEEVEA